MTAKEAVSWKLKQLSTSKFRSSFHLNAKMKQYALTQGSDVIRKHAYDFINQRLKPAHPLHDGKQTPMRANSHPVFIAQHATGTCCRKCLEKWHHIPQGVELTNQQVDYIVYVIMSWIKKELS